MPTYNELHNLFLEKIKEIIEKKRSDVLVEINLKYDPLFRNKYDPSKAIRKSRTSKCFEYDIICFPKGVHKIDYYHPNIFIEFTARECFCLQKFLYETYRWLWFCWNMGLLIGRHPFPETPLEILKKEFKYRDRQSEYDRFFAELDSLPHLQTNYDPKKPDSQGKIFSPRFIQIWKTPTIEKNYLKYKNNGLIAIDIEVHSCENTIKIYGLDINLNRIFKKVYS